jgi:hypothetical protein
MGPAAASEEGLGHDNAVLYFKVYHDHNRLLFILINDVQDFAASAKKNGESVDLQSKQSQSIPPVSFLPLPETMVHCCLASESLGTEHTFQTSTRCEGRFLGGSHECHR